MKVLGEKMMDILKYTICVCLFFVGFIIIWAGAANTLNAMFEGFPNCPFLYFLPAPQYNLVTNIIWCITIPLGIFIEISSVIWIDDI